MCKPIIDLSFEISKEMSDTKKSKIITDIKDNNNFVNILDFITKKNLKNPLKVCFLSYFWITNINMDLNLEDNLEILNLLN